MRWRGLLASDRRLAGVVAIAIATLAGCSVSARAAEIVWRVENPFRLFADTAATALHYDMLAQLPPSERDSPVLAVERRLSGVNPRGWAEAWIDETCWSDREQRYACTETEDYAYPSRHRVVVGLANGPDGSCLWTISGPATRGGARSVSSERPCRENFALDVPYPGGVRVEVAQHATALASTLLRVRDVFVVSVGDSFASGDGNPDVPVRFDDRRELAYRGPPTDLLAGYPARAGAWVSLRDPAFRRNAPRWLSAACHRSLYGHHLRAALQLALEDPHRAVTFAGFACWGTEITDGLFLPMKATEVVPELPRTSQLSAVARVQCRRGRTMAKDWPRAFEMGGAVPELADLSGTYCPREMARPIDLLLVAVGGNDAGFAQLVANAVLSDATPLRTVSGWLGRLFTPEHARRAMATLGERYKALNRAAHSILHVPWSEADRIILTSYPPIALDDDTGDACVGGRDGMTVNPAFALDQRRTREAEQIGREIHAVMRQAARTNGWTFVDAHRQLFARHGFCAGRADRLANPADDVRLPRRINGSWHPFAPSQWEPYAPRRRWIRTPNDGYLTVNFHVPKVNDDAINLLLASSYSGAFHPTAEGHAAMADAVAIKARAVLAKYAHK